MTRRAASRGRARRRALPILAFLVAAMASLLMPAVRPDPVDAQATLNSQATLTVLTTPVEVQRATGNRDTASSGDTLVVGDRVFTGSGGTAKLTFFQGTEVDIAPETELMVQEMTQRQSGASTVSFGQAVGSTVAKVASLFNSASRVQVSTQSAVAVIRGTEVETTVTKENIQVFRSNTGSFDVIAGGQTQRVKDGEVTVVAPPPPPASAPTTRDAQSVGNAQAAQPIGTDRAPLPPVPVAEIGKLFEKVGEITGKDGPRVVATPPVAARDLIDVAQGRPMVLRPMGEGPPPPAPPPPGPPPPPPPGSTPGPMKPPPPVPQGTPGPQQSSNNNTVTTPPTGTPDCSSPASTATPTSSQFGIAGQVVDGSGTALSCVVVKVGEYGGSISGTTNSDASGAFRVFLNASSTTATGTFVFASYGEGHTQQVVPTMTATAGQAVTLSSPVILRANDSTVTGAIWSGAPATPASGAVASVAVAVTPPAGSNSTLAIHVAATPVASTGTFSLSLASGNYSYFVASQDNVGTYAHRSATVAMPQVLPSPSTNAPIDVVLPTLDVSASQACDQLGAPCTITVSGKAWTSAGSVHVGVVNSAGNYHSFGTVTPTNGEFASQTIVSSEPVWPAGTYSIVADQGGSVTARYVKLNSTFVVTPASSSASCTVSNVTATPSASQIKLTGIVTNGAGSFLENACAKVTRLDAFGKASGTPGYALTGSSGAFGVIMDDGAGDFEVLVTKSGYTPQVVPVVHAVASVVTDITRIIQGQVIPLALNDASVSGNVTSGNSSGAVGSGTKVGVAMTATLTTGTGSYSPYTVYVTTAQTGTSGAYTLGIASAASGTYRIGAFQLDIDGYSMRSYDAPLGPVSGSVTRAITLPTLGATGSCPTASQSCVLTVSGAGWYGTRDVNVHGAGSGSGADIQFGYVTATTAGSIAGSLTGPKPQVVGGYSIIAMQDGPDGEYVQAALGASTYSVLSMRSQSAVASASPTPVATTVPPALPTAFAPVEATPSTSTGTQLPTSAVPATVVPAVTPTAVTSPTR